jgi:mono/diheme cytochrome c family protein
MINRYLLFVMALFLSACDSATDQSQHSVATLSGPDIQRKQDAAQLRRGRDLFRQHCAGCHGKQAQGDPNWRHRLANGSYPPPPLNGTGHAWHHSPDKLREMIRDGIQPGADGRPVGNMPAWRDRLDEEDIEAVIAWFQSLWPDPVYAIWYEQQVRARGQGQ